MRWAWDIKKTPHSWCLIFTDYIIKSIKNQDYDFTPSYQSVLTYTPQYIH